MDKLDWRGSELRLLRRFGAGSGAGLIISRNRAVPLFSALVVLSQTELDPRIPTINDSSFTNVVVPKFVWILASREDINTVQSLMQGFYAEEKLHHDGVAASAALDLLFAGPNMGAIFLLQDTGGNSYGYFVLTIGFSLEYGGRYALLDELFVLPSARGQGAGKSALVAPKHGSHGVTSPSFALK